MLIVALVLAVIGLAALVFAVVTSNALVAWVCIGASLLGVLLLIVDALQERRRGTRPAGAAEPVGDGTAAAVPGVSDIVDEVDTAAEGAGVEEAVEDAGVEETVEPDAADVASGDDQGVD